MQGALLGGLEAIFFVSEGYENPLNAKPSR